MNNFLLLLQESFIIFSVFGILDKFSFEETKAKCPNTQHTIAEFLNENQNLFEEIANYVLENCPMNKNLVRY